ncbi:MAG TPA: flippase activity-associated protein Agl23 [Blastocatellia bacterium]|nr:flippase activity-associated protein Agl23 [Blastocatellia bacterium]
MESVELNNKAVERTGSGYEKAVCAIAFILAVIVAVWLRFDQISVKPFHHDEGVNSHFLLNLANHGEYKYNPENYHGPTLYYFAFLALRVFGASDLALRFTPALFGVLTALMVWLLRKHLGLIGTPVAAFLMAVSPGLVYFSRDFIHEMPFGCFSLGVVVGAWRYVESKNFTWLALAATSAGLLFATKETAIVTAVVMIIAALCAEAWEIRRRLAVMRGIVPANFAREFRRDWMEVAPSLDHALAAVMIFVFINIFFYSSFFTNWQGVQDAVKSIALWTSRRNSEHVKGFWYYIGVLPKLELPLLIGSLLAGIFIARRGTRFWLFIAAWTLGLTLAYSIIGYKTPWLMISFLIPMALLSGHAAQRIYGAATLISLRLLWAAALVVVLIFNVRLAWTVNFDKYDDNSNGSGYFTRAGRRLDLIPYVDGLYGYVYAQTDRDIFELIQTIKSETDKLPSGADTPIYVAMPEYWPLPWHLRDYKNASYSGSLPAAGGPSQISQPIIIANVNQQSILNGMPGWRELPRAFKLRPGVELVIYVRDDAEQR